MACPVALSISINEPCDVGADYSIFELMRSGEPIDRPPPVDDLPDTTQRFVRPSKDYRWSSLSTTPPSNSSVGIWRGTLPRVGTGPAARRSRWVNFTLTDAAFHEGGPYSEIAAASVRDTDARIGHILEAVERSGSGTTAFVLRRPRDGAGRSQVTGDWDVALADAGVAVRDEGYGLLYRRGATAG